MLSNYEELFPRMQDELPGCNQNRILLTALRDAGREFCRRTEAWQYELTPISIVANQQSYDLTNEIAYDASILRTIWVKMSGTTANPVPDFYYTVVNGTSIKFNTSVIPDKALAAGLVVKVALLPNLNSDELEEWFMEKWAEAIVGKAMNDLLTMKGKPWFNPDRAPKYAIDYRRGLCNAMAEVTQGGKPGPDIIYG